MAWKDELVETLRVMLNDLDGTTYADLSLERALAVAASQVSQEAVFATTFRGFPSKTDPDILPDPTESPRDEAFINLVCLKAACISDRGGAALAAGQAIYVKDGPSAIDLRGTLQGKLELLKRGWCAAYEEALWFHRCGGNGESGTGVAGAAILGPFRLYAGFGGAASCSPRDRLVPYE